MVAHLYPGGDGANGTAVPRLLAAREVSGAPAMSALAGGHACVSIDSGSRSVDRRFVQTSMERTAFGPKFFFELSKHTWTQERGSMVGVPAEATATVLRTGKF